MYGGVPYFLWNATRPSYKHATIWGVRFYIINGSATKNNLDDRSHRGYFMGYANDIGVIIYWKLDQPFFTHRSHTVWFDEYNFRLSIEDNYTPGSLILQRGTESIVHHLDLINFITFEIYLASTPFSNRKTIT